jgi:hypothetical protein
MSNLIQHAKAELEALNLFSEEGDFYGGMTAKAVMELIEVFSKQEHSGMSAPHVIRLFSKLANFETISALTGEDHEWGNIGSDSGLDYAQNLRNSAVFKHKDGTVTYNNSIIKRCPDGLTWSGPLYMTREDAINATNRIEVKVKGFPFTPKTFYIDVLEEEVEKDDWIMWVKDSKQLDEVFEYYEKY